MVSVAGFWGLQGGKTSSTGSVRGLAESEIIGKILVGLYKVLQ